MFLFSKKTYQPLNKIHVSKGNILHNYRYFQELNPHIDLFPVLKSNAYGHGIEIVGKIISQIGCKYICVDSVFEAYQLFNIGVRAKMLILGYVDPENLRIKRLPFSYAVWSIEQVEGILKYQPKAKLHLFIDTGMNREGIRLEDLEGFAESFSKYVKNIEGIMTHFASADELENKQTENQVSNFHKAVGIFEKSGFKFKYKHASATAGQLASDNSIFNAARLGIGLYGIDPIQNNPNLQPALELTTKIAQVKRLNKEEVVGYGGTFKADSDMVIGILPIGYSDGISRKLSNKGFVKYKNHFCRILGKISMNITTIDLSDIDNLKVGDEVIVLSGNPSDKNSINNSANTAEIIPYELLVGLKSETTRQLASHF